MDKETEAENSVIKGHTASKLQSYFFKGREEMVRRGKMVSGDKRTERRKTFVRS